MHELSIAAPSHEIRAVDEPKIRDDKQYVEGTGNSTTSLSVVRGIFARQGGHFMP